MAGIIMRMTRRPHAHRHWTMRTARWASPRNTVMPMSQYHPDKLMAQGVPEDMVRLGTEKAQEIQAAYDLIVRSRA
jgi:DnaJ-domain-containing protein 1